MQQSVGVTTPRLDRKLERLQTNVRSTSVDLASRVSTAEDAMRKLYFFNVHAMMHVHVRVLYLLFSCIY